MTDIPPRVRNCTTHHEACECREWHYQEALSALRRIRLAANWIGSRQIDQEELRRDVMVIAAEVLEAFKDVADDRTT